MLDQTLASDPRSSRVQNWKHFDVFSRSLACAPDAYIQSIGQGGFLYSGFPAGPNRIWGLSAEETEQHIDRICADLTPLGAPLTCFVESDTPSLEDCRILLKNKRFLNNPNFAWTGMAHSLSNLRAADDRFQIETIEDNQDHREWMDTVTSGYQLIGEAKTAFEQILTQSRFPGTSIRLLAKLDGQASSALSIHILNGVAGIYWVATHPKCRKQGAATAIVRQALQISKDRGCILSVLQATPMARMLYASLGYTPVSTIELFMWKPARN